MYIEETIRLLTDILNLQISDIYCISYECFNQASNVWDSDTLAEIVE